MKSKVGRGRAMEIAESAAESGCPGCCMEAQADGVPCTEIRDCAKCGRAIRPHPDQHALAVAP